MTGRPDPRITWTLYACNAFTFVGIGLFNPILPIYLRSRGGSPGLVGLVFAAGILGSALMQYPGGWASDRFGRRPILIGSLAVFAALFPLYILPLRPEFLVPVRFLQACAGGVFNPSAAALLADLTPPGQRARSFGRLRASTMTGFLIGPAIGGLIASVRLDAVFLAAALVAGLGALLMTTMPRVAPAERPAGGTLRPSRRLLAALIPATVLGSAIGYFSGMYGAVWSLYMTYRGATPLLVGLSYTTVSLPMVLLGGPAGTFADRVGARNAAAMSIGFAGLFAIIYAFVASVPALILLGLLEGVLIMAAGPAVQAAVSHSAGEGEQGRAQGLYQSAILAVQLVASITSGFLFGLSPGLPFFATAAVCAICMVAGWAIWPRPAQRSAAVSVQP